jgi:hypothetical protein
MAFKPSFTGVHRTGDTLVVSGRSDPDPPGDIVHIRVLLAQAGQIAAAGIDSAGELWNVDIPSEGFVDGPAVAFAIETRREHFTTITWSEPVEILAP